MLAHLVSGRIRRRRGATIFLVAISLVVLMGVASLTVDVGLMYNARADLQRAADAGAIAAAEALSRAPQSTASAVARQVVEQNPVLGQKVSLNPNVDVVFGRANYDPQANRYNFTPTTMMPDAVRVTVRKTADSPNGRLPLLFAQVFGRSATDVQATATAAIAPRDIALVADLSGSQLYDSQLKRYDDRTINLHEVWDAFPGGADETPSTWAPSEVPADEWEAAGPGWGFTKRLGFGDDPADGSYDPSGDPGLIRLGYGSSWSDGRIEDYLLDLGYSATEADIILTQASNDSSTYDNRVAVALGLAYWNSGRSNGLWTRLGIPANQAGNGNQTIGDGELIWVERVFDHSLADSADIWRSFISYAGRKDEFRYRYGIKTFMGYTLDRRIGPTRTPEIASAPVQPLQAVKNAATLLVDILEAEDTSDQLSLETYINRGRHELDLTTDFRSVSDRLKTLSPDEYGSGTNIGAGLAMGTAELTSPRVRAASRRIILLLTDGRANRDATGSYNREAAKAYALDEARVAAEQGIQVISISVGQGADQDLMQRIAEIGKGVHFHAEGSIDEYSGQLETIFAQIGGRRAVELIE